jgi:Tol biopolymer transport system component
VPPSTTTTSAPIPPGSDGTIARITNGIGGEGGGESFDPTISGNGRYVAFASTAWDLVPGDPNAVADIYVWDASTGTTIRITDGVYYDSLGPAISADGRYVAFHSTSGHLTPGDLNGKDDVFVWDASTGATTRITDGNGESRAPAISADGRYIAFYSSASNLVPDDTNDAADVFVWDATTGTTTRVSDYGASDPAISGDGRYIAYESASSTMDPGNTSGAENVFVWDATTGTTTRITDGDGDSRYPTVSADGRYIAFYSSASDLVPGDTNGVPDVFRWDATTGATTRATGVGIPVISGDGRYIALYSSASDLVPGDTNGAEDVFLWDATTGTTSPITDGNDSSYRPSISADGNSIAFSSRASNLVDGDTNAAQDVFVWNRSP